MIPEEIFYLDYIDESGRWLGTDTRLYTYEELRMEEAA